VNEKKLG